MFKPTLGISIAVAAVAGSSPAAASSNQAWAAFDARVTRSCLAASGLRNARPSPIVGFDDRGGTVAMLVTDRTRGSNVARLCLYDKRTQRAQVDEADGWNAPPKR